MIINAPRRVNILIMCKLMTDNSRIVEAVHIPSEVTNDNDLIESSRLTIDEIHVYEENISNIHDALVEFSSPIYDDIDISEDDTSDLEHELIESSMLIRVVRYSLVIPMIEDGIENETINTSIITSSKLSEFSHSYCINVVAPNFFSFSETVKFFTPAPYVTLIVSSFSECLELFSDFGHISVGYRYHTVSGI